MCVLVAPFFVLVLSFACKSGPRTGILGFVSGDKSLGVDVPLLSTGVFLSYGGVRPDDEGIGVHEKF